MVDMVEGCMVLVVAFVVLGATRMFLVATLAIMESTSIVVTVLSSTPILIIPILVLDVVLAKEGATKGGTTKFGKVWA
jgi:hypothetical protein